MKIAVIIPIYKKSLSIFEKQSVSQAIRILNKHSIYFIHPENLDLEEYKRDYSSWLKYAAFDNHYFDNLKGYNKLMLSPGFYNQFRSYDYMLVYQTDCYVFRDDLKFWCEKNYDYIGGIWFEDYHGNPNLGAKLWYPGNGGLSLRSISAMTRLLASKKPIKNIHQLIIEKKKLYKKGRINFFKQLLLLPLNIFGFENNFNYLAKKYSLNEDVFFMEAYSKYKKLNIPDVEDVLSFSWDRYPDFLYEKLGQLPFACHAWFREDFPYEGNYKFWSEYIKKNS